MNLTLKVLAPIAVVLAGALAPGASHATLVTMTVTGTITGGYDRIGMFVAPEDTLAGLPYTLSITADTTYLLDSRGDHWRRLYSEGHVAEVSGSVTVAGKTYPWSISGGRGVEISLDNYFNRLHVGGGGSNDMDGWAVSAYNQIGIDMPRGGYVKSLELDRDMAFSDYGSDGTTRSEFMVTIPGYPAPPGAPRDWSMSTWFLGKDHDSMVWTVSPVPEPGQYAMLLFGVGAIAAVTRRARRRLR
jgi:hypothetical protein